MPVLLWLLGVPLSARRFSCCCLASSRTDNLSAERLARAMPLGFDSRARTRLLRYDRQMQKTIEGVPSMVLPAHTAGKSPAAFLLDVPVATGHHRGLGAMNPASSPKTATVRL